MKTPYEHFQFIQQILSNQRLTLTPPEYAKFLECVQVVDSALRPQDNENPIRTTAP